MFAIQRTYIECT